jgi:hypothetical protein
MRSSILSAVLAVATVIMLAAAPAPVRAQSYEQPAHYSSYTSGNDVIPVRWWGHSYYRPYGYYGGYGYGGYYGYPYYRSYSYAPGYYGGYGYGYTNPYYRSYYSPGYGGYYGSYYGGYPYYGGFGGLRLGGLSIWW